jgi:hypothetical protein
VDAVDDVPHKLLVGFAVYVHQFAVPHDAGVTIGVGIFIFLTAAHCTDELHLVHVHE